MLAKRPKQPTIAKGNQPHPQKQPRKQEPNFAEDRPVAWRFSQRDKHGPYPLTDEHLREVLPKLIELESFSRSELYEQGSHPIAADGLRCKEAKKRLIELQHDDEDQLWSLRLAGTPRVWCRVRGYV